MLSHLRNQRAIATSLRLSNAVPRGTRAKASSANSAFAYPTQPNSPVHSLVIEPRDFTRVIDLARGFFRDTLGFEEVHTQNRLSILAACEDPYNVAKFQYINDTWPLPQTGQMWLEKELLTKPDVPGYFCVSTSYRVEPEAVPGRHFSVFPMFEFESKGTVDDLEKMLREFLAHMGLKPDQIGQADFDDVSDADNDVSHAVEEDFYAKQGFPAFLVKNFPEHSHPFWNMSRNASGSHANKIDVIMGGQETIGTAERSSDIEQMRSSFYTVENGEYAKLLFKLFGQERVEQELNDFLALPMIDRYGGGIGVTRLIDALKRFDSDKIWKWLLLPLHKHTYTHPLFFFHIACCSTSIFFQKATQ